MDSKAVTPVKTLEEIKKYFSELSTGFDPDNVLRCGDKEIKEKIGDNVSLQPSDNVYQALTLFEFDKGILMASSIPNLYKVFAVDFLRKLRTEFNCQTPSENATAELATINFIRTMDIQKRITAYLEKGTIDKIGSKFIELMSLELDRANKHFLTSINSLKTIRQPTYNFSFNAQTAVIGQNQMIQNKN